MFIAIFGGDFVITYVMDRMRKKAEEDLEDKIKKLKKEHKEISNDTKKQDYLKEKILNREDELEDCKPTDCEKKMATYIGILERTMYIGVWLVDFPAFIGAWLVVKIVGKWPNRNSGRIDRFLIGTGLSVSIAVFSAFIIKEYIAPKMLDNILDLLF